MPEGEVPGGKKVEGPLFEHGCGRKYLGGGSASCCLVQGGRKQPQIWRTKELNKNVLGQWVWDVGCGTVWGSLGATSLSSLSLSSL